MAHKNIVLFSDGTNNKGGIGRDTNVYRLYKMMDNDHAQQLAFYDDGVGTQSSTPMKLMGLILGWGLSKNVLDLYLSLIGHHTPDAHIYLFGFSRGAFTVRMLANLIDYAGIPSDPILKSQPGALRKWAERALEDYKTFMQKGNGCYPPNEQRCQAHASASANTRPEHDPGQKVSIRCIGVWDTVNATGFPLNSMREAWGYRWIQDQSVARLPQCVEVSFHALAIDEERLTFMPTLWNEKALEKHQHVEQVWFAGVHSNVGGGYPKDGMAHVSLEWMVRRLEHLPKLKNKQFGSGVLHFNPLRKRVSVASDINGKQYNSRAGLAAFYRYKPRDICTLSEGSTMQGAPLIHQSVIQRIRNTTAFYAPYMIRNFRGVDSETGEVSGKIEVQSKYKNTDNGPQENSRIDILHSINARAILYWMFFALTMVALTLPWLAKHFSWLGEGSEVYLLSCTLYALSYVLPDIMKGWIEWYAMHIAYFVLMLLLLFFNRTVLKNRLEGRLQAIASDMWLNLNRGVLQFFANENTENIEKMIDDDALKTRDIEELNSPEQAFMRLERALSKKARWRNK